MRIFVINPNSSVHVTDHVRETLEKIKRPDTELFVTCPEHGPISIESAYDEALAAYHILPLVQKANDEGYDAVILACFSDPGLDAAKEISKIPVIGIEPAVKPAVEHGGNKRILVIATPLTTREKKLHDLIERVDEAHQVDLLALPRLVEFAERGEFDSPAVCDYLKEMLKDVDPGQYGTLVFGCTHFNHFANALAQILGDGIAMIDGSEGTIRYLKRRMEEAQKASEGTLSVQYFQSGRKVEDPATLTFYETVLNHLDLIYPQ